MARWSEADLQEYFTKWAEPTNRARQIAAPLWLREVNSFEPQRFCRSVQGYGFQPDLLAKGPDQDWVFELKHASKYEPLALAEALHHAWLLSEGLTANRQERKTIPVLVTQYNVWLRAALGYLIKNGFNAEAIRYLEVSVIKAGSDDLLWFDEPLAEWELVDGPPPFLPPLPPLPRDVGTPPNWYRVCGSSTWFASQTRSDSRPLIWREPYLMLSVEPLSGRRLLWFGAPASHGEYWSS